MKQVPKIKHIFFDLDHTLWDFDKNSALTYQFIFKKMNLNININQFLEAYLSINQQLWKLFREEKIGKETLRYKRLNDTFKAIKSKVSNKDVHEIADNYILYLPEQTHLFEGAIQVLKYLKTKYTLHIITNGFREVQHSKLKKSNLFSYFNVILDSETAAAKKPNPIIFEKALQLANATKKNSIMIGDSYEADILGALNFGMRAICFNYHNENLPPKIKEINHLKELLEIL